LIPLIFVIAVTLATVLLGLIATKKSKTASDFFVAGRSVGVFMNASAISGEYLSAASFMGIAGLVMKSGYDALWYPIGYAAGYLFLLLFIAGPLRRFGAYTIPDFAQGRFDSPAFRKVAVTFVLFIGFFYTMPQMKGAGLTMSSILGWPYWIGIAVVGSVITFNVVVGGMKGITLVQAFQYWVKVFAIAAPIFVLIGFFGPDRVQPGAVAEESSSTPRLGILEKVKVKGSASYPNNALSFTTTENTYITLPEGAVVDKIGTSRKPETGEDKVEPIGLAFETERTLSKSQSLVWADTASMPEKHGTKYVFPKGAKLRIAPVVVTKGGEFVRKDKRLVKTSAKIEFGQPTTVVFGWADRVLQSGMIAPNAPVNSKWLAPFGPAANKWGFPLLYTYSLIIALVCGTAGLPHILVRFYTNPDGRSAKRTTMWVMVMLGAFYVFTPLWGTLGRAMMPSLYAGNVTDSVLIKLPTMIENKTLGLILSGITSAGAFAAFMSTFSGLLVSMSGAFAHDIYGKILRPQSTPSDQVRAFKVAAVFVGIISMLLGLFVETFDIATMVGWAFAIGAASYFPLLLLGSWWRGLTKTGAQAGMLLGGLLSLTAIVANMLLDIKVLTWNLPPLVRSLMEQPAIWGVPLSLITMYVVSKITQRTVPDDIDGKMLRLHAPEELGLSKDYV
jgi:cation/acetate symporter